MYTLRSARQYATPVTSGVIVSTLIDPHVGQAQTITFRRDLTERYSTKVRYDRAEDAFAAHVDEVAQAVAS